MKPEALHPIAIVFAAFMRHHHEGNHISSSGKVENGVRCCRPLKAAEESEEATTQDPETGTPARVRGNRGRGIDR